MVVTCAGCSSSPTFIKPVSGPLPNLGKHVGDFDSDRLQVAVPVGWRSLGPTRKVVARFAEDFDSLPRIWIRAEALSAYRIEEIEDLTAENVRSFADQLAKELQRRKVKLLEPVKPMSVGNRFFARYVISTRFTTRDRHGSPTAKQTERQILKTVAAGRVYTVDLHVPVGEIPEHRNIGYAVMAGLKIHRRSDMDLNGTMDPPRNPPKSRVNP